MAKYLITGASSGIGLECVRKLSKLGNEVILVARNKEKLERLSAELSHENYYYSYDLNDVEHIKEIFSYCRENIGKLDGMIYAAGVNADIPIKAASVNSFANVMNVNCGSFLMMGKFFANRKYSNDNARIVAISSSASISCDKGMGVYSASKAAMNALVKSMSKEFLYRGILVNAILPAGVLTPMAAKKIQTVTGQEVDLGFIGKKLSEVEYSIDVSSDQPCGMILPDNLADVICYLVSKKNRYITGALIPVSAGRVF